MIVILNVNLGLVILCVHVYTSGWLYCVYTCTLGWWYCVYMHLRLVVLCVHVRTSVVGKIKLDLGALRNTVW